MIESQSFIELSKAYKVNSVPKIIINDKTELIGDRPIKAIIKAIEKALQTD